jgi:uncharacterized protein (DUF488 family)
MTIELNKESVSYVHIEKLGGRRNKLDTNKYRHSDNNNGWKNKSFRAYADYMATTSFREGINELLSLIQKRPNLAIMCAEAGHGVVIEE